ncbi:MAG: efflux transporter outer membrane subunit [Chlorobium sp.]|jgi:NodT family efflux transporter outer membrane factor (OMF) lipoprotein|nr:efflux transporter outer membrane subunit [Chlorobium sp.]
MKKRGFSSAGVTAALLFCFFLSACSVTKEYTAPDTNLPASYRNAPDGIAATSDSSIALIPYEHFFSDRMLTELIGAAVVNNYDLQVAIKNIDYAEQSLDQAKLGFLPSLNLGLSTGVNRPSDNSLSAPGLQQSLGKSYSKDYTAELSTSWEIDIWGKIRSRKKGALAEYLKTREAAKAVRTRLVADVATGYYNLRMFDAQLDIARRNAALADTTLRMMRLQFNAGQVTSLAIEYQEAQKQAVLLSIPKLEKNIAVQENALSILCGRFPGTVQRERSQVYFPVTDNLPTGIPAALLQNRPDVREAEMAVMSAHANMGVARASMYPSLDITAQGGLNSFQSSNWFTTPGSLFGLVQGAILQPIFQRGELRANYNKSKIKREQAELAFKKVVLNAVGEVSDALVSLEKLRQQDRIADERLGTLQRSVRNAGLLFTSGMATYLEVITAQNNLLQAELELADIRRQHVSAMAELYRSLGGGWR